MATTNTEVTLPALPLPVDQVPTVRRPAFGELIIEALPDGLDAVTVSRRPQRHDVTHACEDIIAWRRRNDTRGLGVIQLAVGERAVIFDTDSDEVSVFNVNEARAVRSVNVTAAATVLFTRAV